MATVLAARGFANRGMLIRAAASGQSPNQHKASVEISPFDNPSPALKIIQPWPINHRRWMTKPRQDRDPR
jgi:hypothetical protein